MFDQIAANRRRSYLLLFCVVLLIVGIGYCLGLYFELGEYAVFPALLFALLLVWGSYYHSDKIVLSMSGAKPATKDDEPYLLNALEGLSIAAGLPRPRPYIIEDSAPDRKSVV